MRRAGWDGYTGWAEEWRLLLVAKAKRGVDGQSILPIRNNRIVLVLGIIDGWSSATESYMTKMYRLILYDHKHEIAKGMLDVIRRDETGHKRRSLDELGRI